MFGVNKKGNQKAWEAAVTFAIIFAINFIMLLPELTMPTTLNIYVAGRQAAVTALALYALNKGIEWKQKKKGENNE